MDQRRIIQPNPNKPGSPDDLTRPATEGSALTPPPAPARLVLQRGQDAGTSFPITVACTTIGRHAECDIVINDPTVSRRHATLHQHGTRYTLTDLGSFNGTYVNWQLVDAAELSDGDEVWIGTVCFLFHAETYL